MPLKIVWSFAEAGEGWSEVYATDQSSPSDYLSITNQGRILPTCPAGLFLAARRALLNGASAATHVRASVYQSPGIVLAANIPAMDGSGLYIQGIRNPTAGSTEVFAKLQLRLQCGTTRRRTLWLGGIPEAVIKQPQTYQDNGIFGPLLQIFNQQILQGGTSYGIVGRPLKTSTPKPLQIQGFVPSAGADTALVTIASTAFFPQGSSIQGQYCVIRSLRFPRGWNGVHLYNVVDPTHLSIGPTRLPGHTVPQFNAGDNGNVQPYTPTFLAYSNMVVGRITKRKTGRPFGQPVGRTSAR